MLFCITANYTSHAINALMDNPEANRLAALSNLAEAAGGPFRAFSRPFLRPKVGRTQYEVSLQPFSGRHVRGTAP